ncbi:MAG: hypothetical protein R6V85_13155 [Polyangia bacterium]
MTLFDELERMVRERGVRVEERLSLLHAVGEGLEEGDEPADIVKSRCEAALEDVRSAATALGRRARR